MKNPAYSRTLMVLLGLLVAGAVMLVFIIQRRRAAERQLTPGRPSAIETTAQSVKPQIFRARSRIPARTTFTRFMRSQGIGRATIARIVKQSRPVYNLGKVKAGAEITLTKSASGGLVGLCYQIDPERQLWIEREGQSFAAHIQNIPETTVVTGVSGRVEDSLVQAVDDAGAHQQLAAEIARLFRWQLDFNTDCQPGDTFKVLVRKKLAETRFAGYGQILAAQYDNKGHLYQGILFHDPDGHAAYYTPGGKALEKAFLRSPLRFHARLTSRFSYDRLDPILHRYEPHLGIDLAAPVGSKVQAVAGGKVVFAGWDGGAGRLVRLRHPHGYETLYMHLSRILVHRGERVRQGQVIALTGDTGWSTGPHLDFRIERYGRFFNFLAMHLPSARSVSRRELPAFAAVSRRLLRELAALPSAPSAVQAALERANP